MAYGWHRLKHGGARIGCVESSCRFGVAGTNTIERYYDAFGRDAGYALNGVRQSTLGYDLVTGRQSTLGYDPATGRLTTMLAAGNETPFTWDYLDGSDLKSSLAYPNDLTASWTYGNRSELLEVNNASPTGTISKYVYTYDAAGRRIGCDKSGSAFTTPDTYAYRYNTRSELTNATAAVDAAYRYDYAFDDIGNRETSSERGVESAEYAANNLNQYTAVDDFTPQYDADGNETLVKTATGIWQVIYNGENRPVRWENGDSVITMSFDRMGRRVSKNDQRFVYDGYLQVENFHCSTSNLQPSTFIWDPTEPVATRPLVWKRSALGTQHSALFYTHDGNKNVSEVIASNNDVAAHYEYAPFGALTVSRGTYAAANPWRFSSEYTEDDTATVYYNYRHYESVTGRWMGRDPIEEFGGIDMFCFCRNSALMFFDIAGLDIWIESTKAAKGWHERICVTRWKETKEDDEDAECCSEINNKFYKKDGKFCIQFAVRGGWFSSSSSSDSSCDQCSEGRPTSPYDGQLPDGFSEDNNGDGEIFTDNETPMKSVVHRSDEHLSLDDTAGSGVFSNVISYDIVTCNKEECFCDFDMNIYNYFLGLIGRRKEYKPRTYNCRHFARNLDEQISQWFTEYKKSLEGESK